MEKYSTELKFSFSKAFVRTLKKKQGVILNQRGFRALKKGFVHEAKLKNSFVRNLRNL
jgi:hypothetical protein